jgi:hypothetical protein
MRMDGDSSSHHENVLVDRGEKIVDAVLRRGIF